MATAGSNHIEINPGAIGDEEEIDPSAARDFVLARLAAARARVAAIEKGIDACIACFLIEKLDPTGKDRADLLDDLAEEAGCLSRALEAAQELLEDVDPKEGEPDLPEGDEFDQDGGPGAE